MVTVVTILLATVFWTLAMITGWSEKKVTARQMWILSFLLYVIHIVAAFRTHYEWSHTKALLATAHQTKEFTGWDSGFGLYINYGFTIFLLIDLIMQKKFGLNHRGRKVVDGFVIFMIVNGAIVFGTVNSRIVGGICLVLLLLAFCGRQKPGISSIGF